MHPDITDRNRQEMRDEGYTLFKHVFSEEDMAALSEVLEAFEARMHEQLVAEGDGGISRANEITFTHHIAEQDDRVRAFVTRPEFVKLATEFLGPDVDLYWNQTVFKHPEGAKEFPWHQDDAYTQVYPSPYLTLWLAINDVTMDNGCVSVMPGSYRDGLLPHAQSAIGLVGYSSEAPYQGVPAPIDAGGIVCFWSLTLHKSSPNISKGIRKAYVIQYAPAGLRYERSRDLIPDLLPVARNGQPVS